MASYTFYWNEDTWNEWSTKEEKSISYIAGKNKRPLSTVKKGDEVFIVCTKGQQLYVGGRLIAATGPVSKKEAEIFFGRGKIIDKEIYVLAKQEHIDYFRPKLCLSAEKVRELTFESNMNIESVAFDDTSWRQDFRTPRRLTEESANVLRELLRIPSQIYRLSEDERLLEAELEDAKDAQKVEDERSLQAVKTRRGQPEFRRRLLSAYSGRCCISGCKVQHVLEAAHIVSHSDETDYSTSNGLLLRADLHTLFDLNLLGIDGYGRVRISQELKGSEYWELHGRKISYPDKQQDYPSQFALERRLQKLQLPD